MLSESASGIVESTFARVAACFARQRLRLLDEGPDIRGWGSAGGVLRAVIAEDAVTEG